MKYSEVERKLKKRGCRYLESGRNHDWWYSPITGRRFQIPRHKSQEAKEKTLKNISTALNIQIPELFNFEVKAADENNRLLHQIIARAKNLTPAQQKQVIQILKTFE